MLETVIQVMFRSILGQDRVIDPWGDYSHNQGNLL